MQNIQTVNWVTCPNNPQAKMRLFCFPYAGGGVWSFRTWFNSLPLTVEVCPVELPGRGTRRVEAPFTRLKPLTQALARDLLNYLDKPFAFYRLLIADAQGRSLLPALSPIASVTVSL